MSPTVRSAALGVAAAFVALGVCAALMLFYVEWLWFSDDADGYRTLTNLLLVACAVAAVGSAYAMARIFKAQFLITLLVTAVLLAAPAYLGLRVLSHNNACWAGDSYPLGEEWELWGRECGR
jgi:hypothetical protein